MAKKLEEILKAKGYSDEDLAGMKTLLDDPRFRGGLEEELGTLEGRATKAESDVSAWAQWHQEQAIPTLEKEMKARQDAEADAASNRARLEALQKQGLVKLEEQRTPVEEKKPLEEKPFDPKVYNLVTRDDVAQLANLEGEAIMLAQDIAAEHAELGLGRLNFRKLRQDAMAAKLPVDKYWEQTFKVPDKRAELAAKATADHEAKIRADERAKVASEYANPQTRPGVLSRAPFLPQPKDPKGPQPWDDANARRAARIEKVTAKVMEKVQ